MLTAGLAAGPTTQPTTDPIADTATPRGTLRLLARATRDGDVALIKRLFLATNNSEAKRVEAVAQMSAALADLHRSAVKAFGPEQARTVTGDTDADEADATTRIESADIAVNADTATVTYKDQRESPFVLKKVGGQWRVPISDLGKPVDPAALDQQLADLAVQRKLVDEITGQIEAGKFANAKDARQAWRSRLLQAATSQPATRPG